MRSRNLSTELGPDGDFSLLSLLLKKIDDPDTVASYSEFYKLPGFKRVFSRFPQLRKFGNCEISVTPRKVKKAQ
jgi:hypothetical protein